MALGANTKRALNIALAQYGSGAEVATALDTATAGIATNVTAIALNTAKTSMPTISELTTTTATATTTWLHTAVKSLVADMQTAGHMA